MPLIQKTVYIREEDIEAWNAIPNKAEWISKGLNMPTVEDVKLKQILHEKPDHKVEPEPYKPTHYKPTDDWGA